MRSAYDHSNDKKKSGKEAKMNALIQLQRTEKHDDWTNKMGNSEIIKEEGAAIDFEDESDSDLEQKPSANKGILKGESVKPKKKVQIAAPLESESEPEAAQAKLFVNPLSSKTFLEDKEPEASKNVDEEGYEWSSDEEETEKSKRRRDRKGKFEADKFEEVPKEKFGSDADSRLDGEDFDGMDSDEVAETRALAKRMLRKKERESIIDGSYNRYSNMDPIEALPDWFLEDESRHYRPNIPITKEDYLEEKKAL